MPRMPRLGRDKLMDTILHLFKRSNTLDALKPEQRAFNAQWLCFVTLGIGRIPRTEQSGVPSLGREIQSRIKGQSTA